MEACGNDTRTGGDWGGGGEELSQFCSPSPHLFKLKLTILTPGYFSALEKGHSLGPVYTSANILAKVKKTLTLVPRCCNSTTVYHFWVPTCFGGREQFCAVSAAALVCIGTLKNRSKPPLQVISVGH